MLRVESNTKLEGFTEYEEDILFEDDDPDFDHDADFQSILFKGQRNMLFSQTTTITLSSSNGWRHILGGCLIIMVFTGIFLYLRKTA